MSSIGIGAINFFLYFSFINFFTVKIITTVTTDSKVVAQFIMCIRWNVPIIIY
jgi:hypothetical protein